jgi:SAM-dependent methyltransferase
MTELELIIDLHKNTARQGPGSEDVTRKALELLNLPKDQDLKIADLGCGSGGQTITLAQNLRGTITAVDLHTEFLDELNGKLIKSGLSSRITTMRNSIDDLPFENGEFDLIWSEGAIYNIGFENGIRKWKDFLKIGGCLAVSELTWTSGSRPKEIDDFWNHEYPAISTASEKIRLLETNGYSLVGYFVLGEDCWLDNYYKPLEAQFDGFLERHQFSETANKVVDAHKAEIDLYQRFKDFYSYGFYLARRS